MSGSQCADFNAKPAGVEGLCLMGPGDNAGVVTYTDGRVAKIAQPNAGQPAGFYVEPSPSDTDRTPIKLDLSSQSIDRMKALQGDGFGDCSAQGMGSKFSFTTLSSAIDWPASVKGDIRRLLWGAKAGDRPNLVITCSDDTYGGLTAFNSSGNNRQLYVDAYNKLKGSCGAFDGAHCEALRESLRLSAGIPEEKGAGWEVLKYIGGLLGVGLVFFGVHVAGNWWNNRGGKGGGDGSGGVKEAYRQGFQDGFGLRNQVDGEGDAAQVKRTFPEVATENEGALIYRYQAFIDGVRVGLPAELATLDGQTFSTESFAAASGLSPTVSQVDASDLLNNGVSYTGLPGGAPVASGMQVYSMAGPETGNLETLSQLPVANAALESLPAAIEGSALSWEGIVSAFGRTVPAGAR